MDKEQWKDEVMGSLQGIRRAEPNPFLFTRIGAAISATRRVTPRQWRIAIAVSLILLIINGWSFMSDRQSSDTASPYQLNNHNYKLY